MTVQVRNMELSFEDVTAAIKQFTIEEQERLLAFFTPKQDKNGHLPKEKPENSGFFFDEQITDLPYPNVIDLDDNLSVEEQLEAIFKQQKPIDWDKIEAIAENFDWTEADEIAFANMD